MPQKKPRGCSARIRSSSRPEKKNNLLKAPSPRRSIDPLYPHWFRCDLCGKDVAEVLPAEPLDLANLTVRQVTELCPEEAAEIEVHEHRCLVMIRANGESRG